MAQGPSFNAPRRVVSVLAVVAEDGKVDLEDPHNIAQIIQGEMGGQTAVVVAVFRRCAAQELLGEWVIFFTW